MTKPTAVLVVIAAVFSVPGFAADTDSRQFVEMPPEARATLRAEMLDNQLALHSIISALAALNFTEAGDIAEKQLGISAMGNNRKLPQNARPGMYMPEEMHAIGRGSHVAASDFAKLAKAAKPADLPKLLTALQTMTGACIACHRSYRT
ncbi:MAG: cytochrome c, partial [Gammaproteobacteria bacterium]|nr:cytochrome c [Gammaproteobacteria bacterium]